MILLLEDDAERLARFQLACDRLGLPLLAWRSAFEFVASLNDHLASAALIALDHDLISEPGEPDLGDGLMVAKALVAQSRKCPVIIHTSNGVRGDAMEGELQFAGWEVARIAPLGDDWIEADWRRAVRRSLRRPRASR